MKSECSEEKEESWCAESRYLELRRHIN